MNMSEILLKITDLHASVGDKEILKGVNLEIGRGEIHAVMGPNGAGKSTLSAVLTGKPDYNVTSGTIEFLGRDLLAMKPEERAWAGIFLSFQYPVEIPGVTITNFMKTAVNSSRKARGLEPLKAPQFMKLLKEKRVNVSQIAYSVGFASQTHFSTTFKQYYGVSPTEYIRQLEADEQK